MPNKTNGKDCSEDGVRVERAARRLASQHRFDYLLRQVFAWQRDVAQGKVTGPGTLLYRIEHHFGCILTAADRTSAPYRRHMPATVAVTDEAAAAAAARRSKYLPAESAGIIIG